MNIEDILYNLKRNKGTLNEKKVVLFGSGNAGELTLNALEALGIAAEYLVDNDSEKWSSQLNTLPIKNPKVLLKENTENLIVLVASSYYIEIRDQLVSWNFKEGIHFKSVIGLDEDKKTIFTKIYQRNEWNDKESVSGTGSNRQQTEKIVKELPGIFKRFDINSIVDAPCGDFNWFQHVNYYFERYIGIDIVNELIIENNKHYSNKYRNFLCVDITKNIVPKVDLIFSRDCFVHLSYQDIQNALTQFKNSKSTYILTTTFPSVDGNKNIITGEWRPINLEKEPFNFPPPVLILNEGCTEENGKYADKSLGLWRLNDLPTLWTSQG